MMEQGGVFISVLGTTKLGKSTLIRDALTTAAVTPYIPGQQLDKEGESALWARLAAALEIPASQQKGKVTGNKARWGVLARLGIGFSGTGASVTSSIGGEEHTDNSTSVTYDIDTPTAVTEALNLASQKAREDGENPPVIAIDDFHFVTDPGKRREIILALRPLADADVTVLLATLPGRETDAGFTDTNIGGRHQPLTVPTWNIEELTKIATIGFGKLKVTAPPDVTRRLARESHGSPQIMQQLCLNLCRDVNGVEDDASGVEVLKGPDDWNSFFRTIEDTHSLKWLQLLRGGLRARRERNFYEDDNGVRYDGYQLILFALHKLGSPDEIKFTQLKSKVAEIVKMRSSALGKYALEQKVRNMDILASRDMTNALERLADSEADTEDSLFTDEEIGLANLVPQPVLEAVDSGNDMTIRILDPLLAYALKWHPEAIHS
ncbi:hypothetical protein GTR00_00610 [Kineococcus sp. T90]|nr:hypothetical protein [Kineococcus indalonis]